MKMSHVLQPRGARARRLGLLGLGGLVALFIVGQMGPVSAQVTSTVDGTVTIDNEPLAGADVFFDSRTIQASTDASGDFSVELVNLAGSMWMDRAQDANTPDISFEGNFDATTNRQPEFNIIPAPTSVTITVVDSNEDVLDGTVTIFGELQSSNLEGPWTPLGAFWSSVGETSNGVLTLPALATGGTIRVEVGTVLEEVAWNLETDLTVMVDVTAVTGTLTVDGNPAPGVDMGISGVGTTITNGQGAFSTVINSVSTTAARTVAGATATRPAFVLDGVISTDGPQAINVDAAVSPLVVNLVDEGGNPIDGEVSLAGEANSISASVTGFTQLFGTQWSNAGSTTNGRATLATFARPAEITAVVADEEASASWDGTTSPITIMLDVPARPECNGLTVTVDLSMGETPTSGDDVIRGTAGDDVINALDGNDVICALQGDDRIDAGEGFDKVFAGAGDDTLIGGIGNDRLIGGAGNDIIAGGKGNDRIQGGSGTDNLAGGNGADRLAGGSGNDTLRGGGGADQIFGHLGRDRLFGDAGNDTLRGGAWLDEMDGGAGSDDGCTLTDPSGLVEVRINCEAGVFGR